MPSEKRKCNFFFVSTNSISKSSQSSISSFFLSSSLFDGDFTAVCSFREAVWKQFRAINSGPLILQRRRKKKKRKKINADHCASSKEHEKRRSIVERAAPRPERKQADGRILPVEEIEKKKKKKSIYPIEASTNWKVNSFDVAW